MTRRARRAVVGGAVAAGAIALACSQVSTDPNSILALQLDPPVLPSIVLGDSLHKLDGSIDSLHATAFNSAGQPIPGAPISFVMIVGRDTATVGLTSGQVVGIDTGIAKVIASASTLQTVPQTLHVVLSPDSVAPLDSTHYAIDYNKATLRDTLFPIRVKVLHVTPIDTTGVTPYRVEYAFTFPANTNLSRAQVQLVNAAQQPQLADTTQGGGASTLSLLATLLADPYQDTVGIDVSVYHPDHTPVAGSPVHFVITLDIH